MSEKRDMGGIIFKNSYKEKDSQPDYKGEIVVNGKDFEIALWVKEGQKGKFFSVKISEPYVKPEKKEEVFDPNPKGDKLPF